MKMKLNLFKRRNRFNMMTSKTLCEACDFRGIKQEALVWCHDCEEAFCSNCAEHHSSARKTREHMVISMDNYSKLPPIIRKLSSHCEQHNAQFQNYCIIHEQLCCRKCIDPLHSRCTSLPAVDDFLKDTKRSFLTEQLSEGFKDIHSFCEHMVKEKTQNLRELHFESNRIENRIKQMRKQLDIIEAQRKTALSNHKSNINKVVEQLTEHLQYAGEFNDSLSFITENASNIQVFLASKKFEQDLQKAEESVTSLQTRGALSNVVFCLDDIMVKNIDRSDIKLGSFSVKTLQASKTYVKRKTKEIQMFMVTRKPTINSVKLTLLRKLSLPDGMSVTGCLLLPRGGIIITGDFYVVFLDSNGSVNKKLQLRMAYDVTCIDDNRIAVTDDAEITFIDRKQKEVIKRVRAEGYCFGISHSNGSIIYTTDKSKVKKMDLHTDVISTLNVGDPIFQSYVVGSENKIFYSNWQEHTVICYDINGSALWKFKDETVLRNPSGISVDKNYNVFVAGLNSNNVVIISHNGNQFKQIPLDGDGISNPRAISLDKENKLMLVCSERSRGAIYKIE
ncbi:uncharacterized protein LOC127725510 isoform X2 [Mytilus californianus]|uniref:uncharacterized protein LOC127725510 isoform X2 n=1 Tax=Mytilus californianus TaxID=6549 RepID=UPI0022470E6E|nr:uncharacterized protein LOC127725510 isoform X2 [Mytilus californianus]